jgi:hypothetical protein
MKNDFFIPEEGPRFTFPVGMMASADLSSLFILLQNSLSVQESLRKDAEAQLEQVWGFKGCVYLFVR